MERANLLCTLSIFAIFIATGCNGSYNTVPIATSAKNVVTEQVAQRIRDAVTLDKPSLIVVESHAESWEQFRSLVVELVLVNPLRVPVSYDGFTQIGLKNTRKLVIFLRFTNRDSKTMRRANGKIVHLDIPEMP